MTFHISFLFKTKKKLGIHWNSYEGKDLHCAKQLKQPACSWHNMYVFFGLILIINNILITYEPFSILTSQEEVPEPLPGKTKMKWIYQNNKLSISNYSFMYMYIIFTLKFPLLNSLNFINITTFWKRVWTLPPGHDINMNICLTLVCLN